MQDFPHASVGAMSLLNKLLTYDPAKRLSARAALRHSYFQEQPPPKQPADFPTFPSAHDTGLRQKHQRRCLRISTTLCSCSDCNRETSTRQGHRVWLHQSQLHQLSYQKQGQAPHVW